MNPFFPVNLFWAKPISVPLSRRKRESGWPGHPLSWLRATHFHGSCYGLKEAGLTIFQTCLTTIPHPPP